jgi:hypothetical protein
MGFANQRTINGANALIKITPAGGSPKIVGYASGITVTEAYILNRIDVLGQIDSIDIEAIGRTVSGSIALMRMTMPSDVQGGGLESGGTYGGGASANGLIPKATSLDSDQARTNRVMQFMNEGFTLEIIDSDDFQPQGEVKVRYKIIGCRPSTQSFGLSRGSIMGVNVTFEALKLIEEDDPTV